MSAVILAFDEIGLAVQLQEAFEARGHTVLWAAEMAAGPTDKLSAAPDVVALMADAEPAGFPDVVESWRTLTPTPAVLALGTTDGAMQAAKSAKATFVASTASTDKIHNALTRALSLRFAGGLSLKLATNALGLETVSSSCLRMA